MKLSSESETAQSKMCMAGGMPDWSSEEEKKVFELYPSAEKEALLNALTRRSWYAIRVRARLLGVRRDPSFKSCANIKSYERPKIAPETLGYIASFLDCEGSIGVNIEKDSWHLHPHLTLDNQNKEALEFMAKKVGFGNVKGGGHERMFRLSFDSYNAIIIFLETVLPLLIIKANKAQLMIAFCKSRLRRLREGKRGYSEEEVEIAKRLTKYTKWNEEWTRFL